MLRKEIDNQIIEFQTDEQNTPAAHSISRATLRQLKYDLGVNTNKANGNLSVNYVAKPQT